MFVSGPCVNQVYRAHFGLFVSIGIGFALLVLLRNADARAQQVPSPISDSRTRSDAALESWLRRFGLHDLLIRQYERDLEASSSPAARRQMASQLLELYSQKLITNHQEFAETSQAWDRLVDEFPDAIDDSTALTVAFGHYRQALDSFDNWMWNAGPSLTRQTVHRQFQAVSGRVESLHRGAASDLLIRDPETTDQTQRGLNLGDELPADMPDLDRPVSVRQDPQDLQRDFLLAWSLYYQGITDDSPESRVNTLTRSADLFRRLLQVPTGTAVTELRPQWFALDSQWLGRVLTGLEMASQALEDSATAAHCYALLGEPSVPFAIRQFRNVHRFESMFFAGQIHQATAIASSWANRDSGEMADPGLWRSIARAGLGARVEPGFDESCDQLMLTGLGELVKLHDWSSLDELFDQFDRPIVGQGFLANWLEGYRLLRKTPTSPGQRGDAIERLQAAVNLSRGNNPGITAENQFELRARCRVHLGRALYLNHRDEEAIEQFRLAIAVLNHTDPGEAENASWMLCQAMERLSLADSAWQAPLLTALDHLLSQYPQSDHASDARFLQLLVQIDQQSLDAAIKTLREIPSSDLYHPQALLELCRRMHQTWKQGQSSGDDSARMADGVVETAERLLAVGDDSAKSGLDAIKFRVSLLAADVLVHGAEPQVQKADQWLSRFADPQHLDNIDPDLAAEYHLLNLDIARELTQPQRMQDSAGWLSEHASRTEHRRAGLLGSAELLDQQWLRGTNQSGEVSDQLARDVIARYQRVVSGEFETPGSSADLLTIKSRQRLAELYIAVGDFDLARDCYLRLSQVDANRFEWVLGLAKSATALQRWEEAAEYWQRIAAASDPGDNQWLESRYQLVNCLIEAEPDSATASLIWQQTKLLAPGMPGEWALKFEQLKTRLHVVRRSEMPR